LHKSDYEHFVTSPMWHEIEGTCKEVKVGLLEDLANMDPIAEATDMARKQGRLKMLDWLMAQPRAILEEIEIEQQREKERGE
jgi:hypothetical protein